MVREYTDKQLLDKVKSLPSFIYIPSGYWILGVRSKDDLPDRYDDKFYLFKGKNFILVTTGTTNPGTHGLLNFANWNSKGVAVVKADLWQYGLWMPGMHKGRMRALVQRSKVVYYRDNNKNLKSEEIGKEYKGFIGINFHGNTYNNNKTIFDRLFTWVIGQWSVGCQVVNNMHKYYETIDKTENQKSITFVLVDEFEPI